jgi:hypothetical protein
MIWRGTLPQGLHGEEKRGVITVFFPELGKRAKQRFCHSLDLVITRCSYADSTTSTTGVYSPQNSGVCLLNLFVCL